MWSIVIPEVPDGDWPLLFLGLNAVLLVFIGIWCALAACSGTPPDEQEEPAKTPPMGEPAIQGGSLSEWKTRAKGEDPEARIEAIEGLKNLGVAAIPVLTKLLRDSDQNVVNATIEALGQIGPEAKTAIPLLTEWLDATDSTVRNVASNALQKIKQEKK